MFVSVHNYMIEFNILSHNVFWFQGFPSPVDRPPELDVEVLRLLCAMYQDLNPDVICLQEIQSEHVFHEVCGRLGMTGFYCEGKESSKGKKNFTSEKSSVTISCNKKNSAYPWKSSNN